MRKMMMGWIILTYLGTVSLYAQPTIDRTKFFPQTEEKPVTLPDKANLWVFVMAGQSNMAGRGFVWPQDTVASPRVMALNRKGEIILAKEPLQYNEPKMAGLGCGLAFGKALIEHLPDSIAVLIVQTAIGGSSISQWLGDSIHRDVPLLSNFIHKVEIGKRYGTIKAVLWHQGESDANEKAIPYYKERLAKLFRIFREAVGNSYLPVLAGELGSYSRNYHNWMMVNEQIRLYAESDLHCRVVSTHDFVHNGDSVHFDSGSQRILGKRFAETYLNINK